MSEDEVVVKKKNSEEENLGVDNYISNIWFNLNSNSELDIFKSDNVYSVNGFCRSVRDSFSKIIFINPGPSIDNYIDELKSYSGNEDIAVFCSDICLPGLHSQGIYPDYVVTLDPSEKTSYYILDQTGDFDIVASSASPIYRYFDDDREFFLFNSVEENSDYRISITDQDRQDPEKMNHILYQRQKSDAIHRMLREVGISSKYNHFLAWGTVSITMYQLAQKIRGHTELFGFDFYIEEEKPYAEFISQAVYSKLKDFKELKYKKSYKKYITSVIDSYFEGEATEEKIKKSSIEYKELGKTVIIPPLLAKYKLLFYRFSKLAPFTGKSLKFR